MIITNCDITHTNSKILRSWKVSSNPSVCHTGIDISGSIVYSICFGAVVSITKDFDGYAVTVQYDDYKCVRYCHLSSVDVQLGTPIKFGEVIGKCNKYVHFEYLISDKCYPYWSVNISDVIFYKCDPTPVLFERKQFLYDYREDMPYTDTSNMLEAKLDEITPEVLFEFEGSKGQ